MRGPPLGVILLLPALLFGCTVGPDFVPPKAETPPAWTVPAGAPLSQATPAPVASAAWWESFRDPTLTSLVTRAAASNLDVRAAALKIAEARANRDVANAGLFPTFGANASYARERISEKTAFTSLLGSLGGGAAAAHGPAGGVSGALPGLTNPFGQYQAGFDASWELDFFGRVRRSVEAAGADADASVEDGRGVLISLEAEVARDYIDLRAAQLRRTVLADNLATERDILALARDRRQAGLGNDLDVANAGAQVSGTEAELPPETSRATQDMNGLSFLLGAAPGALAAELDTATPIPPIPPQVPVGLPADLLRRRPDIRAAEARLHAATARVGVAVAELFPAITLSADGGFQAAHAADLGAWAARFFSVGPSIDLPIFSGGERQANVRLEDVRSKEAAVAYARAVLASLQEVENALAAYAAEQSRHGALDATVAQNRDALDLARQRYAGGITTFLDVLEAERGLQQAELALADSTAALSTDLVALYKALGGGWDIEAAANTRG
jgi:NodT family efflux transporter outer membrane factor (OMF) lipoprotein